MTKSDTRMAPLHCPYCGDEELLPEAQPDGAWRCTACLRVFTVRLVGLALTEGQEEQEGIGPE